MLPLLPLPASTLDIATVMIKVNNYNNNLVHISVLLTFCLKWNSHMIWPLLCPPDPPSCPLVLLLASSLFHLVASLLLLRYAKQPPSSSYLCLLGVHSSSRYPYDFFPLFFQVPALQSSERPSLTTLCKAATFLSVPPSLVSSHRSSLTFLYVFVFVSAETNTSRDLFYLFDSLLCT